MRRPANLKLLSPLLLLPAELGYLILEFLVDDPASLYALSLTSGLLRVYALPLYLRAVGLIDSQKTVGPIVTYEHTRPVIAWRGMRGLPTPSSMSILIIANAALAERQLSGLAGFFVASRTRLAIPNIVIELGNAHVSSATCNFLQTVAASGASHLYLKSHPSHELRAVTSPEDIPIVNSGFFYPRLQKIQIKSTVFFSAEYIKWTVHTLNSAALTALDLQLENRGSPLWRLILPHLHLEHLEILHIDGALPVSAFFRFLSRHPRIRELEIGRFTRSGFSSNIIYTPSMDRLQVLMGPHAYITPLLVRSPPVLQRLVIIPDHPYAIGPFLDSEFRAVIASARGCMRLQEIDIALPYGYIAEPKPDSFFVVDDPQRVRAERCLANVRTVTIRAAWNTDQFTLSSTHRSVLVSRPFHQRFCCG